MTRDGNVKKVVRRHAEETGQRCTEAMTDLEGLTTRMRHEPVAERLLGYRRALAGGVTFDEWGLVEPPDFHAVAAATSAAFRR